MSHISRVGRKFLDDIAGVVTIDWVAVTATFVVIGIGIIYAIFGDEDGGLVAIVKGKQEQLSERADDVSDLVSDVESWSPSGS